MNFITDPPSIKSPPGNVTKTENQAATFNCSIDAGNPISAVTWLYNGAPINTSDGSMKYSVNNPSPTSENVISASLTINNVVRGDQGRYRCKGENSKGFVTSDDALLNVQCKYSQECMSPNLYPGISLLSFGIWGRG